MQAKKVIGSASENLSASLMSGFRFSLRITLVSIALAIIMLKASHWQWTRYLYKKSLVATYSQHQRSLPQAFPTHGGSSSDFADVLHRKVELSGEYDFEHQVIVANRRHASGPGFWLLTPLKLKDSEKRLIVSRGFIPFSDREPQSWAKYSFSSSDTFEAVVQDTVPHRNLLSPKNDSHRPGSFNHRWLYPDLEHMAKQFPYPIYTSVFVQRLGGPPSGVFPAEAVSVKVPPSTHFGYTIEWALLACTTLVVGFLLQAFPRNWRRKKSS